MARDRLWVVVYVFRGVDVFLFPHRTFHMAQLKFEAIAEGRDDDHRYNEDYDILSLEDMKIPGVIE